MSSGLLTRARETGPGWWLASHSMHTEENVVHWTKQIIAIACGVVFGAMPLLGFQAVLTFFSIALCCTYLMMMVMRVDLAAKPDMLVKEGSPAALALFFLTWTTVYTLSS